MEWLWVFPGGLVVVYLLFFWLGTGDASLGPDSKFLKPPTRAYDAKAPAYPKQGCLRKPPGYAGRNHYGYFLRTGRPA